MAAVMQSSFAQTIFLSGDTAVSYRQITYSGANEYGEPVTGYTSSTITAYVRALGDKELVFIEPGFNRAHYTKLYLPHSVITPAHLDRYVWNSITFEVRSVIPRSWNNSVIWYDVLGRRVEN